MSSTLDAVLTIAGFVVGAPIVLYLAATGILNVLMTDQSADRPWRSSRTVLDLSALVVPPTLLLVIYLVAIVFACRASGLTFPYPLVALAVGFAAWYATIKGLSARPDTAIPAQQDIDGLTADQAIAAVHQHLKSAENHSSTGDLTAERFPLGWSVSAPTQGGTAVFLVGDSGRIERSPSGTALHDAQRRFTAQESAIVNARARRKR